MKKAFTWIHLGWFGLSILLCLGDEGDHAFLVWAVLFLSGSIAISALNLVLRFVFKIDRWLDA